MPYILVYICTSGKTAHIPEDFPRGPVAPIAPIGPGDPEIQM